MSIHRRLPALLSQYRPALYRQIVRKSNRISRTYTTSVVHRPYTFHIGASWAGKPEDPGDPRKVPFPEDTLVGGWRDKMLSWPKHFPSTSAGEDFFFVQEVRSKPGRP